MSCFAEMEIERCEREGMPEGFDAWCRIEDLCGLCGLDPAESFDLFSDIMNAYPGGSGRMAAGCAEEHPMEALADAVRRYLAEYPEEAMAANAGSASRSAAGKAETEGTEPVRAA